MYHVCPIKLKVYFKNFITELELSTNLLSLIWLNVLDFPLFTEGITTLCNELDLMA